MKAVWRRECIDPCNTFYIQAMQTAQACIDALQPMVYSATQVPSHHMTVYLKSAPKPNMTRKRVLDCEDKMKRMLQLEQNLRRNLLANAQDRQGHFERKNENENLLEVIGSVLDASSAGTCQPVVHDELNHPVALTGASPLTQKSPIVPRVIVPSPQREASTRSAMSNTRVPPSPLKAAETRGSRKPLSGDADIVYAYDNLVTLLVDYDSKQRVDLRIRDVCDIINDHPNMFTTQSTANSSAALDHIFLTLAISGMPILLVKSLLPMWLARLRASVGDAESVSVQLGFYVASSPSVYRAMYDDAMLPACVTTDVHSIESDFCVAQRRALVGVQPVFVVFPTGDASKVPGSHMLPLAVVIAAPDGS